MQKWYRYILQVMLGLCSCMPLLAMNISNNIQHMKHLLDNDITSIHTRNSSGMTLLHKAIFWGKMEAVEAIALLLDRGADIESKALNGWTPLHYAAYWNKVEAMALLLDRGAHIESKDDNGWTPLYLAAECCHVAIVALLLDRGANIESIYNCAVNKLNSAFNKSGQEIIDLIIRSKPYYINMSQRPSTLLGTVIMHLLKKSKERNSQHKYDYVYTAQQVATKLHGETAVNLLNALRTVSTFEEQQQEAKRYLKQYIERQDANAASELAAIQVRKEGLRKIAGHIQSLKDVI